MGYWDVAGVERSAVVHIQTWKVVKKKNCIFGVLELIAIKNLWLLFEHRNIGFF